MDAKANINAHPRWSAFKHAVTIENIKQKLKKFFNSRLVVVVVLLTALLGAGTPLAKQSMAADYPNTSEFYQFGTVYQQFLLSSTESIKDQTKGPSIPLMGNGMIGSGGVSGSFSYDGLIQQAGSKGASDATAFSRMMATYSYYNYMSYSQNGFSAIVDAPIRLVLGLILTIFGVILDIANLIQLFFVNLILTLNVIPALGEMFAHTAAGQILLDSQVINLDMIKMIMTIGMIFTLILILITVAKMAQANSQGKSASGPAKKLMTRVLTLVLLPFILVAASSIMAEVSSYTSDVTKTNSDESTYAHYLIDVESWAKKYNFAPHGSSRDDAGGFLEKGRKYDGYVDLSFNPYGGKDGSKRINEINAGSTKAQNRAFANTSLAMDYLIGSTFTAQDYIDAEATYTASSDPTAAGASYGGYADLIDNQSDINQMVRTNKLLTSTLGTLDGEESDTGYTKAVGDYVAGDTQNKSDPKIIASPIRIWQDRFIYGTKRTGAGMKDYYDLPPSSEQITSRRGAGDTNSYSLSDQSMFLVLQSNFNATGGHYYIDAPARGILKTVAQFDSSRGFYYTTSMVGIAGFTVPALLTQTIVKIVTFLILITVVLTIGVLEMNIKPITAWVKAAFTGEILYLAAFGIYMVGIIAEYFALLFTPEMLEGLFMAAVNLVQQAFNAALGAQGSTGTAGTDLIMSGFGELVGFLVAIIILIMWFKNPRFSKMAIEFASYPWSWAALRGERFELDAGGKIQGSTVNARTNRRISGFDDKISQGASKFLDAGGMDGLKKSFDERRKAGSSIAGALGGAGLDLAGKASDSVALSLKDRANAAGVIQAMTPGALAKTNSTLTDYMKSKKGNSGEQDEDATKDQLPTSETADAFENIANSRGVDDETKRLAEDAKQSVDTANENPTDANKREAQAKMELLNNRLNSEEGKDLDVSDTSRNALTNMESSVAGMKTARPKAPVDENGKVSLQSAESKAAMSDADKLTETARGLDIDKMEDPNAVNELQDAVKAYNLDNSEENYNKLVDANDNVHKEITAQGLSTTKPIKLDSSVVMDNVGTTMTKLGEMPEITADTAQAAEALKNAYADYQANPDENHLAELSKAQQDLQLKVKAPDATGGTGKTIDTKPAVAEVEAPDVSGVGNPDVTTPNGSVAPEVKASQVDANATTSQTPQSAPSVAPEANATTPQTEATAPSSTPEANATANDSQASQSTPSVAPEADATTSQTEPTAPSSAPEANAVVNDSQAPQSTASVAPEANANPSQPQAAPAQTTPQTEPTQGQPTVTQTSQPVVNQTAPEQAMTVGDVANSLSELSNNPTLSTDASEALASAQKAAKAYAQDASRANQEAFDQAMASVNPILKEQRVQPISAANLSPVRNETIQSMNASVADVQNPEVQKAVQAFTHSQPHNLQKNTEALHRVISNLTTEEQKKLDMQKLAKSIQDVRQDVNSADKASE